jgi:hypothetical protein
LRPGERRPVVQDLDVRDRRVEHRLDAVARRVLHEGVAGLVRVHDARGGGVQRVDDVVRQRRLLPPDAGGVPPFEAGHALGPPARLERVEVGAFGVVHRDGELADPPEREPELRGKGVPRLVAGPLEGALEGGGVAVVAGVNDAAVRLAGPEPRFALRVDQHHRRAGGGQGAREGGAHHARPDHGDVVAFHGPTLPPIAHRDQGRTSRPCWATGGAPRANRARDAPW